MARAAGPRPLTPTALAGHLACTHLTQLQRAIDEGRGTFEFRKDPRLDALRERGFQHERAFVADLAGQDLTVLDLARTDDPAQTLAALRSGVDVVVQAPMADGTLRGRADVLRRVAAPSRLGAFSYEPYDTKLARETKAGTLLQLCCYAEMLAPLQGHEPEHLHVVTPLRTESYRTADFAAYVRLVRRNLIAARSGPPLDHLVPDPVPHCDVCGFWLHCDQRRRAADHLSLVAGLGTRHVRELVRQGITTLTGFARAGRLPEAPRRGRAETYQRLAAQATLQVAARSAPLPPVEVLPVEPGRGFCRLPEPSPGDVFLDFEGDPFVGEGGLEYLTGWTLADQPTSYAARWALDRSGEKAAVEKFLDLVAARLERHPELHVYHFHVYEPAALKRMVQRHGTRAQLLDRLLRGERFVDLHAVVREGLRIGVESYGLKQLEPLFGFRRELGLEQSKQALQQVELSLELGDAGAITAELRQEIEAYNRDDCRATHALRDWLEAKRQELLAGGAEVPRPALRDGVPSEKTTEREQRIAAVADPLRAGVPADPAARDREQAARALLADQLGYFAREEKCAWWEHFRLRDLDHEDLFDEREALAGLQHLRSLPVKGSRLPADQYRFPPQESTLAAGDLLYVSGTDDPSHEGAGTRLGKVTEVDLAAGTITIHKTGATVALHPRAVFQDQVVPAGAMETALLAFGGQVRDQGLERGGPFTTAAALLRRTPPRPPPPGPAGADSLATAARWCRALDGEVLPVQGPPGTGKTHTGAHAILALVADGRKVGVTAVSHKVIDNLLDKVDELAREQGVTVRLVHKDDGGGSTVVEYLDDNDDALATVAPRTVVGGTAWFWARDAAVGRLDHLFVDEAGQMALAQVLAAARSARNLVLLGDPQQLEQPRKGSHPEGAEVAALVHLIGPDRKTLAPEQGLFLDETRRLHPALCRFTAEMYYENRLRSRPGLERQRLDGDTPFTGAGLFLVEVDHEGNQSRSPEELDAVETIVRRLLRPGVTWTDEEGEARPLAAEDLLVVAPYNAQVAALRARLGPTGVTKVSTVDKFQGQEAPVVIYSCAASSAQDAPRGMDFLYDPHRFNVATSRARSTVIVVGSPRLFEPECRTPDQVRMANGLCRYRELATVVVV